MLKQQQQNKQMSLLVSKEKITIIGMMSGTSLDGIDLAACSFQNVEGKIQWQLMACQTYPYIQEITQLIRQMESQTISFLSFKKKEQQYTRYLSKIISQFIIVKKLKEIDYLSIHGHTIFHNPQNCIVVQATNINCLAALLKIDTIANFRQLDVFRGGQGAPLAPYGQQIFEGGIANIGFCGKGFDISFCNLFFNHFSKVYNGSEYDQDGKIGAEGTVNNEFNQFLVTSLSKKQKKSLSRQDLQILLQNIDKQYKQLEIRDKMATFYKFLSEQIISVCLKISQQTKINRITCTGGGAFNKYLLKLLNKNNQDLQFILPSHNVINFKQAILFAYLGFKFLHNHNNCSTGVGGNLVRGSQM